MNQDVVTRQNDGSMERSAQGHAASRSPANAIKDFAGVSHRPNCMVGTAHGLMVPPAPQEALANLTLISGLRADTDVVKDARESPAYLGVGGDPPGRAAGGSAIGVLLVCPGLNLDPVDKEGHIKALAREARKYGVDDVRARLRIGDTGGRRSRDNRVEPGSEGGVAARDVNLVGSREPVSRFEVYGGDVGSP